MPLSLLTVEWLGLGRVVASWSSIFESVEWNTSKSTERCFLLEMSLGRSVWTGPCPYPRYIASSPTPLGRAPCLVEPPWLLRRTSCTHIYRRTLKLPETQIRSGVPPPEASVATENQSRPVPAPCRRGQSFFGGHLHHPGALHDEEGVVLPRG